MVIGRALAALSVLALIAACGCERRVHTPSTPAPDAVKETAQPSPSQQTPQSTPAPAETTAGEAQPRAEAQPQAKETDVVKRTETDSGLIIEDLVIGTGAEAQPLATVTIHYRGTLPDGKEFDSSYSRGQPATFSLRQLIKGWQEGIPGMKIGGKRRLIVPPELGYGSRGVPGVIPPDSTLVFEIELIDLPPR